MPRFYGKIGYGTPTDKGNGVWEDVITERSYYGDVDSNYRRYDFPDTKTNPDLKVSNVIKIVADRYSSEHFHLMKYIVWEGVYWTIDSVEVKPPRLTLRLGSVYNGPRYISPPPPEPEEGADDGLP